MFRLETASGLRLYLCRIYHKDLLMFSDCGSPHHPEYEKEILFSSISEAKKFKRNNQNLHQACRTKKIVLDSIFILPI